MFCKHCGSEIHDEARICPECGETIASPQQTQAAQVNNKEGTLLGIIAIIGGIPIPLIGWLFGGIGLSKAKKAKNTKGIILNAIGIIAATISFIIYFSIELQ